MSQEKVARLGDTSDHGGVIITASSTVFADGIKVAAVGDLHSCPIPGHGITAITNGSGRFFAEGDVVAVVGSVCGCGARINTGSARFFAPFDGGGGGIRPFTVSVSRLDGPDLLA
jgi:uncharacterized Zn-binding protein involved in type VI secretion